MNSVLDLVIRLGYPGIILASFLENFFPPIPSEVVIPFVGFLVSIGVLSFPLVVLSGVAGTLLGAIFWYGIGNLLGGARVRKFIATRGRYLGLSRKDLDLAENWFEAHGEPLVFFGRLVPIARTLVSIPAGFAKMNFPRFILFSFSGILIWNTFLTFLGFLLGESWGIVSRYLAPLNLLIMLGLGGVLALFLIKKLRKI